MAVISLRLNQNEENMVKFLSKYYEQDKSSLIKYSLNELYEDIIDKGIITEYETKEKNGKNEPPRGKPRGICCCYISIFLLIFCLFLRLLLPFDI